MTPVGPPLSAAAAEARTIDHRRRCQALAAELRRYRETAGLTPAQLADQIGVDRAIVGWVEAWLDDDRASHARLPSKAVLGQWLRHCNADDQAARLQQVREDLQQERAMLARAKGIPPAAEPILDQLAQAWARRDEIDGAYPELAHRQMSYSPEILRALFALNARRPGPGERPHYYRDQLAELLGVTHAALQVRMYRARASIGHVQRASDQDVPKLVELLEQANATHQLIAAERDQLTRQLAAGIGRLQQLGVGYRLAAWRLDRSAEAVQRLRRAPRHPQARPARTRGKPGRQPAMTAVQIRHARALLALPAFSVTAVAQQLGVSRSTLYKYVPELGSGAEGRQ